MRYTLLRLTPTGILLCEYHRRRLRLDVAGLAGHAGPDAGPAAAFARFAREAEPGVWAVWVDETGVLRAERRPGSALRDGMPVRHAPTPLSGEAGSVPKPRSPSVYDAVRRADAATLLTSPDGTEIYEACRAAVLGWDGARIACVPCDRPRVWSTAETAVRDHAAVIERPLAVDAAMPLLLVNAAKGTCTVAAPGRELFPEDARAEIERLLGSLTSWPS